MKTDTKQINQATNAKMKNAIIIKLFLPAMHEVNGISNKQTIKESGGFEVKK